MAERVGKAVKDRRDKLGLTAQQLAARTAELGYPINRVAISKIESNARAGKIGLAELTVLAAALDIPPVQLIFPKLVDGMVPVLPNRKMASISAIEWFNGEGSPIPREVQPPVDHEEAVATNRASFDGRRDIRIAYKVASWRSYLGGLIRHPAFGDHPDPDRIKDAVEELEDAKEEARHHGLIVDDGLDYA